MSAAALVQRQVEAYNAQDIEAFCGCFAENCVIADLNGAVTQSGQGDLRARYSAMFAQYPHNKAEIVNRMALGDLVIDHEIVDRAPGVRIEAIAIYTVRAGKIARVDFIK